MNKALEYPSVIAKNIACLLHRKIVCRRYNYKDKETDRENQSINIFILKLRSIFG